LKEIDGMFQETQIGFIGGGNMGEALVRGLIAASLFVPEQIRVYDISTLRVEHLRTTYGIVPAPNMVKLAGECRFLVLAVKPQHMSGVLSELRSELSKRHLVISIAAGIPMALLRSGLGGESHIIRVMPNTPALILEGASALARGTGVTDEEMQQALRIFGAVGKAVEVDESMLDVVTGLSGSGPAYIFLILEALIDAGVLMGLPRNLSRELVLQTALGSVKMVQETGKHPAELKELITSPGGTTVRGLRIMEQRGVRAALLDAVEAATLRSVELGKRTEK
jgi:pyrroline-5-carboxylate reductase